MTDPLLAGLNPQQREAVLHRDGPLLILAGAGSGKTRVVTRRIARLIATGVDPAAILAITFTNKAAGEMRERVGQLIGRPLGKRRRRGRGGEAPPPEPTISTFHSFCVRVLRRHAPRLGYSRGFSILDGGDALALVREAAVAARVDVKRHRPPDLAHTIGRAKERLDDEAFAASAWSELDRAAARVLPIYRQLQRERDAMDFEDLLGATVTLLEEHAEVRAQLQDRLRYVSIDEYQDTNHAQYRLATLLAGERRNLAVCGDPDQSIYGWRGADMRNILRFEEEFPGATVVLLEENYRSAANVLQASNALIAHNSERKEKQLRATHEAGPLIDVLPCIDPQAEAEQVARRIKRAVDEGMEPGEVAVLFRAAAHAQPLEDALVRLGVPCALGGATSFFERREVKDALAYVKLGLNPKDDLAAVRALKLSTRGVGARSLEKLHTLQRTEGVSLVEACRRAGSIGGLTRPTRAALERFAGAVSRLGREADQSVERLVMSAIAETGLEDGGAADPRAEARAGNLRRLAEAARRADRRGGGSGAARTRSFLDGLALLDGQDRDQTASGRVTLTTVHAAKGLEFDLVFVVGLEEGLFPHQRAVEEGNLEEERRLAYVAFTRARRRLVLSYATRRGQRGRGSGRRRPSRFLYELPGELLWDPQLREAMVLPDPDEETPEEKTSKQTRNLVARALQTSKRKLIGMGPPVGAGAGTKEEKQGTPLWARGLTRARR